VVGRRVIAYSGPAINRPVLKAQHNRAFEGKIDMTEGGLKVDAPNLGVVSSVRGSVVDIRFDGHLPPIYSLLHAQEGGIVIEVLAQLDARHVRGIALTPTQGLARGMAVEDSGGPLKTPVGKGILSRMFDVFGNTIDREAAPTEVQWRSVHRAPPPLGRRSCSRMSFRCLPVSRLPPSRPISASRRRWHNRSSRQVSNGN
jgi:ATP synthase alpha/beta family, beta-barrel domain